MCVSAGYFSYCAGFDHLQHPGAGMLGTVTPDSMLSLTRHWGTALSWVCSLFSTAGTLEWNSQGRVLSVKLLRPASLLSGYTFNITSQFTRNLSLTHAVSFLHWTSYWVGKSLFVFLLIIPSNVEQFRQVGSRKCIYSHVRRTDDCTSFWGCRTFFCAFMEAELKPDALAPCFYHWNTWRKEEVRDEDRCSR